MSPSVSRFLPGEALPPRLASPFRARAAPCFVSWMALSGFWASFPTSLGCDGAFATFSMRAGDEHWVVLGWNVQPGEWSVGKRKPSLRRGGKILERLECPAGRQLPGERAQAAVQRSALTVQLLSHAHHECRGRGPDHLAA